MVRENGRQGAIPRAGRREGGKRSRTSPRYFMNMNGSTQDRPYFRPTLLIPIQHGRVASMRTPTAFCTNFSETRRFQRGLMATSTITRQQPQFPAKKNTRALNLAPSISPALCPARGPSIAFSTEIQGLICTIQVHKRNPRLCEDDSGLYHK